MALTFLEVPPIHTDFRNSQCAVLLAENCVDIKPTILSQTFIKQYRYANIFESRNSIYNLRRCRREERPEEGTISVHTGEGDVPVVIFLYSSFGIGAPYEKNDIAQAIAGKSRDDHFRMHVQMDTEENRLAYFSSCLKSVFTHFKNQSNNLVEFVIVPAGIGHFKADTFWLEKYLPILETFAEKMIKLKISTIITGSNLNTKVTAQLNKYAV